VKPSSGRNDDGAKLISVTRVTGFGGKEQVETGSLRFGQQVAVGQPIPSPVFGLGNGVPGRNRAMPRGVTWSKRMRIDGVFAAGTVNGDGSRLRAANSSTSLICSRVCRIAR